jgi:sRNA-binding protein
MPGKAARSKYQKKRRAEVRAEVRRGLADARARIAELQERWPAAFPNKSHMVRPLATGIAAKIADATGWSRTYVRGVLTAWKCRAGYCEAVLRYERRYDLDGKETSEVVDDQAREQARWRLDERSVKRAREQEREPSRGETLPRKLAAACSGDTYF